MGFLLGIDTGGTYTDAALLDEQRQVVAVAKRLTTRHDLTIGIENVLEALPKEALEATVLVALSTTLTTNSVVEGRGAPVCLLLAGYVEAELRTSGLRELLGESPVVLLRGGHDAMGEEVASLDEAAADAAILAHCDRVSAFAVSAMFSVRNPAHEIRLRERIQKLSGKPVTCGHELAASLGAPRRAVTVALNARMIPYVERLIRSVRKTIERRGVDAPLMIVKGDGSLISADSALLRPIGTVLSGPAASVVGACALSGLSNAIVADMGGTTTDIAVVSDGSPELSADGALIGDWRPMVEAVKVYSIGLGGDSEARFHGGYGLRIGPRRVVPLSLLAHLHPQVVDGLKQQLGESPNPRHNRYALRLDPDQALLTQLSPEELAAWEALSSGPIDVNRYSSVDRPLVRALARLERKGLVIYSGFTPTDAAHVLGLCEHWCKPAAQLGAQIWARQNRHVYGYGSWAEGDALGPSQAVYELVVRNICEKLVEAGLNHGGYLDQVKSQRLGGLLTALILEKGGSAPKLFRLGFAAQHPVVAVGAPAHGYYPRVAADLGVELKLPTHAEVANAVGAVMGSVAQRVHITITQPFRGTYRVHSKSGPEDFSSLYSAVERASQCAANEANALAFQAGAATIETHVIRHDQQVNHDIDGYLFVESRVTAVATGRPRLAVR